MDIFAWQNVIFIIPLIIGILMIIGSSLGFLSHGDVGHDIGGHDIGHDVSHGVGHDHDAGHDQDGRGGATKGMSRANALELHGDAMHGPFTWLFSFLGIGRVPFTVLIMVMALVFGGTGMCSNYMLAPLLKISASFAIISIAAACFTTFFLTGLIARLVNRVMPSTESYNVTSDSLVGKTGTLYVAADAENGSADIKDQYGDLQRISCRYPKGVLPIGSEIVVVEYRKEEGCYIVEPFQA